MKLYTLKRQQVIARPLRDVFGFFEQPDNLRKITPESVGFHMLTPRPIKMQTGTVLDYSIRLAGLPIRWTTLISAYDPPHRFCDVAVRSPYSFWHHTHTFRATEDGTVMVDEVRYALPFGLLGRLVHAVWVRRQLNHIFDYRAEVISRMLENNEWVLPEGNEQDIQSECA